MSESAQTLDALDVATRSEGAMTAFAMGDALGWPQEDRGGRVGGRRGVETKLELVSWSRREGGRYAGHETTLEPGAYSDDTQLVLAVSRALLNGADWWRRWTSIELPFWLLYERGGGGATKRAARSWAQSTPPWTQDDPASYFNAGGNGVAMRVLPHAIVGARDRDFSPTAERIVTDGIATHGHPRALIGALAAGYALWRAVRREDRLGYGELVAETRLSVDAWSPLPVLNEASGWREAADATTDGGYELLWSTTVAEMLELLAVAEDGIQQGTLAVDRDVLKLVGAYDSRASGAGTVAAAAALFIASRYASRPSQGLLAAAFASGTDSDTIAAMTGALLGAINGPDWLGTAAHRLQDYAYITQLAHELPTPAEAIKANGLAGEPAAISRFSRQVASKQIGENVELPDGRRGRVENVIKHPTRTRNDIRTWVVATRDGQTLFVKKIRKTAEPATRETSESPVYAEDHRAESAASAGMAHRARRAVAGVEVADIPASVAFYRDLLGLTVTRETPEFVNFGGSLLLIASPMRRPRRRSTKPNFKANPRVIVFADHHEIATIRKALIAADVSVSDVEHDRGRACFRCLDPTGAVVEIREPAASTSDVGQG